MTTPITKADLDRLRKALADIYNPDSDAVLELVPKLLTAYEATTGQSSAYTNLLELVEGRVFEHPMAGEPISVFDEEGDPLGTGETIDEALAKAIQDRMNELEAREAAARKALKDDQRKAFKSAFLTIAGVEPDKALRIATAFRKALEDSDTTAVEPPDTTNYHQLRSRGWPHNVANDPRFTAANLIGLKPTDPGTSIAKATGVPLHDVLRALGFPPC